MEKINKTTISAVILTKGEKYLIRCIESLGWCGEIIIVADVIRKRFLAYTRNDKRVTKIYKRPLNGDFSSQRNFGLEKAKGDWVLFVDADEVVSDELRRKILAKTQTNTATQNYDGFYIKRKDFFLGRWLKYGETGNIRLLRLAKKGAGKWKGRVHEVWAIKGKIGILNSPILHYPHPTISSFLEKINQYTDLVAQYWVEQGRKMGWWEIIVYPIGKFIKNFLFKLGFLDGVPGLIMAAVMSFHSFLVRGKYWLKYNHC